MGSCSSLSSCTPGRCSIRGAGIYNVCVPSATSPAPKQPSVQKNTESIQKYAAIVERSASSPRC